MNELPNEMRTIIAEEEALLSRVKSALAAAPKRSVERDTAGLWDQLRELRDEAATASERDLPSLFQQMRSVRALAETAAPRPLPEPSSPYFAHLKLKDDKGSRDFLLGRATFIDTASGVRVVDWRFAPVARIFYRYQVGDEFEEDFPGGVSQGLVEARRIVVVERGELTRIIDGRTVLVRERDGAWRLSGLGAGGVLGGGAGTSARPGTLGLGPEASRKQGRADITALLDAEQFEALSAGPDRPLLVLGSAGSGKTTVALHRLAKLAFDEPERFPENRMRVVVPEEGLARLSRRLLAPLGLDRLRVQTLNAWLEREAMDAFGAGKIKLNEEPPALVQRLKRHPALRPLLLERMAPLNRLGGSFPKLRRKLAEILSDHAFLARVVDATNGDLPRTAIEQTAKHTMLQLATPLDREYAGYDPESLMTVDGRTIDADTPDALAGTVDPEDLALLLFLRARAGEHVPGDLAHFVLDEAEDVSLYELEVLSRHLGKSRSCTLAGDEMQQTESGFAGWPEMLATLGGKSPSICRLQVSYRCPKPVVEFARKVLGTQAPGEALQAREGVPVGRHHFPDEAQAQLFLVGALRDLLDREPEASVGIVASSEESAERVAEALEALPQARLVLDGSFTFDPGVDVTDVENAKGLEWDYVIVPDATVTSYPATDEARRRLHVAVTRTSHQLWVLSAGTRSPIVTAAEG